MAFYDGQHILWKFPRKPSNAYVQELIWQYSLSDISSQTEKKSCLCKWISLQASMTVCMFVSLNIALICTLRVSLITSLATTCQVCILLIVRQHGFIFYDGQHILWEFPRKPSNVYVQELIW